MVSDSTQKRKRHPNLRPPVHQAICQQYEGGRPVKKIAETFDISVPTLYQRLKEAGIPLRQSNAAPDVDLPKTSIDHVGQVAPRAESVGGSLPKADLVTFEDITNLLHEYGRQNPSFDIDFQVTIKK